MNSVCNKLYFQDGHIEEIIGYDINHLSYVIFKTAANSYLMKNRTFLQFGDKFVGQGPFIKYVPKVGIEDAGIIEAVLTQDLWQFKHKAVKFGITFKTPKQQ